MLQNKILSYLVPAVLVGGAFYGFYLFGYLKGHATANAQYQAADIQSLNGVIDEFKALAKDAKAQSLKLSNTISARQVADQQSTQVFANALNATAHLRFDCRFDDNIMQQIFHAADRADQAAASGFGGALPASAAPDG